MNFNASFHRSSSTEQPLRPWLVLAAICAVLASAISIRATTLKSGNSELRARVAAVEQRTAQLTPGLEKAEAVKPRLRAEMEIPEKVNQIRNRPRWGEALRTIATAAGGDIALQGIHESETENYPGHCDLQINGVSRGADARNGVDVFRGGLEKGLKTSFPGKPISVRIGSLGEGGASEVPFTITAVLEDQAAPFGAGGANQ
jgi:hypothetical protein